MDGVKSLSEQAFGVYREFHVFTDVHVVHSRGLTLTTRVKFKTLWASQLIIINCSLKKKEKKAHYYLRQYSGFSGHIADCSDILIAELQAIYQGLRMVRALGISDFVCYSDSLHSVSLINGPPLNFHTYAATPLLFMILRT